MAHIIQLPTFNDKRGKLTVLDDITSLIPFEVKRIFYIYDVDGSVRGRHRHKHTIQAAICIHGSCVVCSDDGKTKQDFVLDSPSKCLLLNPEDYHYMKGFTADSILLVMASTRFDPNDYIFESY